MTRGPALRRGVLVLAVAAGLAVMHALAVAPPDAARGPMAAAHAVAAHPADAPAGLSAGEASPALPDASASHCALAGSAAHAPGHPASCLAVPGWGQMLPGSSVAPGQPGPPAYAEPAAPPGSATGPPPPLLLLGRLRV
ncbi:MAG: hypothetical protein ACOYY2_12065 [Actinomycetota bacterium]